MRFFKKEIPQEPLLIRRGLTLRFRQVKSGVGVLATDNPVLLGELDKVLGTGGLLEIDQSEYMALLATEPMPIAPSVKLQQQMVPRGTHVKFFADSQPTPEYPSFVDQTDWECGIFNFPPSKTLTAYFNPSVIDYRNRRYLFTRQQRMIGDLFSSDLAIFEVRPSMHLSGNMIVPHGPARYVNEQWEDPRVVLTPEGGHAVSFATWIPKQPHLKIRQALCRLAPNWTGFEVLHEPIYGGNHPNPNLVTRHEKNWCWFHQRSQWHFVYTIQPHVVVRMKVDGEVDQRFENEPASIPWAYGEPRGGTPPIKVGDEYLCFFHSAIKWKKPKRRYFMGAYTFSVKPPFQLLRVTPKPLLVGSEADFRVLAGPPCVFPCGALLEEGASWIVTFGVNDEQCGWVRIPVGELEERLERI